MSNFKVGEVLVGQNHVLMPERNGMECVVVGSLRTSEAKDILGNVTVAARYEVLWVDGRHTLAKPSYLRRKKPPTGEQSILSMFKVSPPKRIGEIA